MSTPSPADDLNALAGAADATLREQQEKAAAQVAVPPQPSGAKRIVAGILLLAFLVLAWLQYPRFHEPFGRVDPDQDTSVAEADLGVIASLLEGHRRATGQYPASFDEAAMPDSMAAFVSEQKMVYRKTDLAYAIEWSRPRWKATLDGSTGQVSFLPNSTGH
jgi:hypothetical protein